MAGDDNWWQSDAAAPTGGDFLKTLDPARASQVKALAEGRMDLPKGTALRSPVGQQLLADVAQYDPSFDVANAPARTAARKAFTSGVQGRNITSFNTAIGHLGTLAQAAEQLHNRALVPWNSIANAASSATGDPGVTNFNIAKQAVVDELERAFKGTGGNLHEIEQWENTLNSSRSPAQLRGAIKQAADLLNSRIGAMRDSYNAAMGTTEQPLPMLNQHASEALSKFESKDYLDKGYAALAAPAAPNAPGNGGAPGATGGPDAPPPSGPAGDPNMPTGGSGTVLTEADHAVPAEYGAFQKDLENGINGGFLKTPEEAFAYAKARGFNLPQDQVAATFDYIAKGGRANVATPVTEAPVKMDVGVTGAANFANAVTFGTLPKLGAVADTIGAKLSGDDRDFGTIYDRKLDANNTTLDQSSAAHPIAALTGNVAGFLAGDGVLGALPGAARLAGAIPAGLRPLAGDALYGAAYGAGSSDHLSDVPMGVLTGGALAGAGGVLGRGAVRSVANIASPLANASVRRLTDAGVTLTPGQILGAGGGLGGRMLKGAEDRLAGFPIVGDVINATRRGGVEDFNRAAINDALAPLGATIPGQVMVGHEAVGHANRIVSEAYDAALAPMRAVPDAQFADDLRTVAQRSQGLSSAHREQLGNILDTDLQPYMNGRGELDGSDLQSIRQGLGSRIPNLRGQGSTPQDRELADHLESVQDAVMDMAARSTPDAAADFQSANQAFSLLSRVKGAAAKAKDGVFTPNQFRQAVTKRGYGTTTNNVATGSAPMQQLATDASTVLPSTVPDSGTSGRVALGAALQTVPGAALGGVGGAYQQGDLSGAAAGAVLGGALFSRPSARVVQYALAGSRGRTFNTLGDVLRAQQSLGGLVGAPLLLGQGE